MKAHVRSARSAAPAVVLLLLCSELAHAQITPAIKSEMQDVIGNRIEAATVLGGDYGLSGLSMFNSDKDSQVDLGKLGGRGPVGDPRSLGFYDMTWQPMMQGNIGYLEATRKFNTGLLAGDKSKIDTLAVELGGGARFNFNEHFSLAPLVAGIFGHSENDYHAQSAFGQANKDLAKKVGIIDWDANTWSIVPGIELRYFQSWRQVNFEFTSSFNYFHTEAFDTSSSNLNINGDSETWINKLDVDVPLDVHLFGYQLHTGGFFSRSELFDNIEDGLGTDHIYEIHSRLVLDFGDRFKIKWMKLKWLGLGGSYLWGSNFDGWSIGADMFVEF